MFSLTKTRDLKWDKVEDGQRYETSFKVKLSYNTVLAAALILASKKAGIFIFSSCEKREEKSPSTTQSQQVENNKFIELYRHPIFL
jgi:UPF0288 family protein (methanogenesis marker protein 3)